MMNTFFITLAHLTHLTPVVKLIIKFEKMQVFNSHISGKFTVPHDGVYMITFSYQSTNDPGEGTYVFLKKDGVKVQDNAARHWTGYSSDGSGTVFSTGGRAIYQRLEAGNNIYLETTTGTDTMYYITMCVQFLHD